MRVSRKMTAGLVAVACVGVAACAGSSSGAGAARKSAAGGVVTVAELPESPPNYVFPFVPAGYNTVQNVGQFQSLMYRPLYWLGSGASLDVDPQLSLAAPPAWNAGHDVVTIRLKKFKWSDGTSLTPRDVAFWLNLARAEKKNWADYTPGQLPDNIKSTSYDDATNSVTFRLTSAVSPSWFLYDQLALIVPLPTAWDRTASNTAAGCSAEKAADQPASCKAVYNYLNGQAKKSSDYAASPLWKVVDGPFELKSFEPSGRFTMVPNRAYSGAVKPKLAELQFLPFTSESAEYNSLRSGTAISVGYAPSDILRPKKVTAKTGPNPVSDYTMDPVIPWGFSYLLINFNNPAVGPLFRQLYIRQAMQRVVDQNLYIEKAGNGYGAPSYGPVPLDPPSPFTKGMSSANPYPFDVGRAKQLLTSHGWSVPAGGVATCRSAGSGAGQCGAGIQAGQRLQFNLESFSGVTNVAETMSQFSADASRAGIGIKVKSVPPQQMVADAVQCKSSQPSCKWQLINYGSAILSPYPAGNNLFSSGAGGNVGNYADPQMDRLLDATLTSPDPRAMVDYGNYAAQQIPVIWLPNMAAPIYEVNNTLQGVVPISPFYSLTPEKWSFTK